MKASDLMINPVITVPEGSTAQEAAALLVRHRISGAPVVDKKGKLIGMVSDGDLMHRSETHTERKRSWLGLFATSPETLAREFIKEHSRKVTGAMTRNVVSAGPDASLSELARLMDYHSIKRVPIVDDGRLLGIVTRANLVQALASSAAKPEAQLQFKPSDTLLRGRIMEQLRAQEWTSAESLNITVADGVVDLFGYTEMDSEKEAIGVLVENIPGVRAVNNRLARRPVDYPYS